MPETKQIIAKSLIKRRIIVEFLLHFPVYFYFCCFVCIIWLSHSLAAMCVCHVTSQENFLVTDHDKVVFVKRHKEQKFSMQTCPCNVHPLTPHFYLVRLGFTGDT